MARRATQSLATAAPFHHPLWLANIEDWHFFKAAYEGGRHYLRRYLDRHAKELDVYFTRRVERAVYPNATRSVVETFVAHVFHEPVARPSDADDDVLAEFHANIDLQDNPADAFYAEALSMCLQFGVALAVCDRLDPEGAQPTTRAQERELGRRPYGVLYTPMELVDWDVDRFGTFRWALFVETDDEARELGDDPENRRALFKLWTREDWRLLTIVEEGEGKKKTKVFKELDRGTHPVGRVPVAVLHFGKRKGRHPIGESAIKDLAPMNRRLANLVSLIDEQSFQHVFNVLAVPDSMFDSLKKMNFSTAGAISFPDQAKHPPFYLAPDVAQLGVLREEVNATMAEIRVLSGVGRQNEASMAQVSGKSMALQTMDKVALLEMLAERLARFETRLDEMALRWMERDVAELAPPEYDKDFDPESLNSALEESLQFESMGIGGLARLENFVALAKTYLGPKLEPEAMAAVEDDIRRRFTPAPVEDDEALVLSSGNETVEALNGAQVAAIVNLAQSVATGNLAAESAIATLQSAFAFDAETARRIVEPTAALDIAPELGAPVEPPSQTGNE